MENSLQFFRIFRFRIEAAHGVPLTNIWWKLFQIYNYSDEYTIMGEKKYFQIDNYSDELKAKMDIYNLTGRAYIWWQVIKKVKGIKEIYIT